MDDISICPILALAGSKYNRMKQGTTVLLNYVKCRSRKKGYTVISKLILKMRLAFDM